MKAQPRSLLFWTGVILLMLPGFVHAYLLMPFPGSQNLNAITICYYLEEILFPVRLTGATLIIFHLVIYFSNQTKKVKVIQLVTLVLCVAAFYFTDFMFKAEVMFEEPKTIKFANAIHNKVPESFVVIGLVNNGVAKAYPLLYLGYHHKIQDNVGDEPVLVTYCTMCRAGRVYSPVINGVRQNFRLVGAQHYNAVIEDEGTKTWWYQATGKAAVGKLKGSVLQELPYEQSTLQSWLNRHPGSLILQPDQHYMTDYHNLRDYDRMQAVDRDSTIKDKDKLIRKSWVLAVIVNGQAKAYDWRQLDKKRVLNDSLNKVPLLIALEDDSLSFHVFDRSMKGMTLHFKVNDDGAVIDRETSSGWNWDGLAISGPLVGNRLTKIQAYQEYWHSWKHFHPNTLFWNKGDE